jgi:hypothetical protein
VYNRGFKSYERNRIRCKREIENILVENGEVVEYGQPLFEISPI